MGAIAKVPWDDLINQWMIKQIEEFVAFVDQIPAPKSLASDRHGDLSAHLTRLRNGLGQAKKKTHQTL